MNSKLIKKQTKHNGFSSKIPPAAPRNVLSSSLRGLAVAFIGSLILLFAVSALIYAQADPNRFVSPAALLIFYVGALVGGFFSAKRNRTSALLCGLLTGFLWVGVLFIFSLFMNHSLATDRSPALSIGLRGIAIAVSVLGAYAGVNTKKKTKSKKR